MIQLNEGGPMLTIFSNGNDGLGRCRGVVAVFIGQLGNVKEDQIKNGHELAQLLRQGLSDLPLVRQLTVNGTALELVILFGDAIDPMNFKS